MIKAHIFLDGELKMMPLVEHCPRIGETLRVNGPDGQDVYGKVTEVIWCMNEHWVQGQRANIRLESEESE